MAKYKIMEKYTYEDGQKDYPRFKQYNSEYFRNFMIDFSLICAQSYAVKLYDPKNAIKRAQINKFEMETIPTMQRALKYKDTEKKLMTEYLNCQSSFFTKPSFQFKKEEAFNPPDTNAKAFYRFWNQPCTVGGETYNMLEAICIGAGLSDRKINWQELFSALEDNKVVFESDIQPMLEECAKKAINHTNLEIVPNLD